MSIKLGNTGINKLFLGSTEVNKAYLGDTLVFGSDVPQLYDNVSVMYTLRQPPMTTLWTKAVIGLRRTSDNTTTSVFFDTNGKVSLNSTVTASEATLGDWVGVGDSFLNFWQGITPDNTEDFNKQAIQFTTSLQPQFISGGVIITKNGEPTIDFLNATTRYLDASPNSVLDSGNTFTALTVSFNNSNTLAGAIFSTTGVSSPTNRYDIINDRRTQKFLTNINNGSSSFITNSLLQQDSGDQKIITGIVRPTDQDAYFNGIIQETLSWTGAYNNNTLRIGTRSNTANDLNGGVQEIIIFSSDKTADLTELHNDINDYYNIY